MGFTESLKFKEELKAQRLGSTDCGGKGEFTGGNRGGKMLRKKGVEKEEHEGISDWKGRARQWARSPSVKRRFREIKGRGERGEGAKETVKQGNRCLANDHLPFESRRAGGRKSQKRGKAVHLIEKMPTFTEKHANHVVED